MKTVPKKTILQLRPIGKRDLPLNQLKKIGAKIQKKIKKISPLQKKHSQAQYNNRISNYFQQQQQPSNPIIRTNKNKIIFKKLQNVLSKFQDPNRSIFLYQKFSIIEQIIFILTIFAFFVSVLDTQIGITYSSSTQLDRIKFTALFLQSGCTFMLVIMILLRYLMIFQIQVQQKKRYVLRYSQNQFYTVFTDFIRSGDQLVWLLLLEVVISLPHPFAYLKNIKVSIFQPVDQIWIQHDLNDILSILMLMRVYIIFRSLVSKTIYSTPRASRLCHNNGVTHDFLYCVKCILHENPIMAIGIAECLMILILGYALKLSEGTLGKIDGVTPTGFQSFGNCFWCVFITMGTIGYGDYYPKTVLGRSIAVIASISGVILSSLLIVALSNYLNFQSNQSKSHITLTRLYEQQRLKDYAKQSLAQTLKVSVFLNQSNNNQNFSSQSLIQNRQFQKKEELKQLFDKLKKKIDATKMRTKLIRNIVDTDNMSQQMNRMFEIFKDSLKDSYQNQLKLKHCFDSLQKQQSEKEHLVIKKTFARQMEDYIQAL